MVLGTFSHWGLEPARVSVGALVVQGSVGLAYTLFGGREHLVGHFQVDVLFGHSHSGVVASGVDFFSVGVWPTAGLSGQVVDDLPMISGCGKLPL